MFDPETHRFLATNDAAAVQYGYSSDEFIEMTLEDLQPRADVPRPLASPSADAFGTAKPGSWRHAKKDGSLIDVEITAKTVVLGGKPCGFAVVVDVTERRRLEVQLRQAQKMDAIGNLAGGIAHDFNNLLSVILSYSEMLAETLEPGGPMGRDLAEITRAGNRAADLTHQLLAFSRKQILQPKLLDLNATVGGIAKLLRRVVGEDVELAVVSVPGLATVSADPGQVEQVLMNLVVNARDAMPKGGKLTIEAANVWLDSGFATQVDVEPGAYVMLSVTDTGSGMDAATRERVFEPFFTTKEKGKGTGLGLSTVFGIVQQSGGKVVVDSVLGKGTSVKVYFPQACGVVISTTPPTENRPARGSETVLLVEDEEAVRVVTRTILERHGYHVLEAQSGLDALRIGDEYKATIHLLLTDVVMPSMSGTTLAGRLGLLRPEMKALYVSGYTDDAVLRNGVQFSDVGFLQKPFTPETLTRKLREVIEAPQSRSRVLTAALDAPGAHGYRFAGDADPPSGIFGLVKAHATKRPAKKF
ncbi:MAG: ATP-binding protein [Polyangiaceae bacterium]